ncbi:5'/3'-nucleotidase SurE [Wenyingzhuangia sp. IMCC45574]
MSNNRPKILVTNDDGITAVGIRTLIAEMCQLGDVYVVAPDKPQSGKGHAITIDAILELKPQKVDGDALVEVACTGTPADCVKLAINEVLDTKPDLCVSGINHGSNSSISVIYSGTMSAAIEAGIEGIPAIGFSLCDFSKEADFTEAKPYVRKIAQEVLENGLPDGIVLNVNFPKMSDEPYKGVKICRQARANWREKFDKRTNPIGKEYFWLTGEFENLDTGEDTDEYWLAQHYISLVPIQFDLTAHHMIQKLNTWKLNA